MSNEFQRDVDDLSAAYALGALSEEDRALFEEQASKEARAEARGFAEAAAALSTDSVEPSPFLRASVLDAIARTPQEQQHDVPDPENVVQLQPRDSEDVRADSSRPSTPTPTPAEAKARQRWRPMTAIVAIAAAAALVTGGIAIGAGFGKGASDAEALGTVVAAADAERSEVEFADGTAATVVWSASEGRSAILFDNLEQAPQGSTYQAWYIDDVGARSAGTFDGEKPAVLLEGDMSPGVSVGVTLEPAGGSDAPTTDPIFVVET